MNTCNMIGSIHCGCAINTENLGNQSTAHLNMGNKPHQWRTLYQCKECKQKEDDIRAGCGPQEGWRERRISAGLSQGQAARLMSLGTAAYSQLEHCKMVAPDAVRADFDRMVSGGHDA